MNIISKRLLYRILVLLILLIIPFNLIAQNKHSITPPYIDMLKRTLDSSEMISPNNIRKINGHYTKATWQALIDSIWGQGLSTVEKLEIFNNAWNKINTAYAAFQNLSVNIDSLKELYLPEIEHGVSRGRFAAIMNYLAFAMNEAHTILADIPVNYGTILAPGIPIFVIGPWQDNSWFGANLTPLPDSSLLVYRANANQALGLEAGDIVLGYDGVPWKNLYKELIDAQLPIRNNGTWASTNESLTHCILSSAGLNWHLFDVIDIVKQSTGDTIHLPTSLLVNQSGPIWGNEQMPIPGVDFPNVFQDDWVSWGVVDGTHIGYIYVQSWSSNPQLNISAQFYNAVDSLMNYNNTTGLILDFRNNNGGWMPIAHAGYSLLFNTQVPSVAFDIRSGNTNHFDMIPHPTYTEQIFTIPGNPSSYYDKPIAVLTGPGSISNGDFESYRMKLHPMARLFGKPSCGAFATSILPNLNNNDWFFLLTSGNGYPVNSPGEYLTHTNLEIDEDVWLTQNGVINGLDDVVESAMEWINLVSSIYEENDITNFGYHLSNNYPNPFNPTTQIGFTILEPGFTSLKVYDVLGNEISTLINEEKPAGNYSVKFDATRFSSGIYYYTLRAGNFIQTKKMIYLK